MVPLDLAGLRRGLARIVGAEVVVVDLVDEKLKLARTSGQITMNAKESDPVEEISVFGSTPYERSPDAIGDEAASHCPPPVKALTDSRLAALCANAAYRAFLSYQAEFHIITRRAADRFPRCDWLGASADAAERLGLYGRVLDQLVAATHRLMGDRLEEKPLWAASKAVYSSLITHCNEWEIAESFFNSLTRRVFATVGVNQQVEFVDSDFDAPPTASHGPVRRCYQGAELPALLAAILTELGFPAERYDDLPAAAAAAAARLETELGGPVARIEMAESIFFRRKGAYLVGAAFRGLTFALDPGRYQFQLSTLRLPIPRDNRGALHASN